MHFTFILGLNCIGRENGCTKNIPRYLFAKVLLLNQLCVGILNPLSFLVYGILLLRPTRITMPGAESILAGQGLHRQLHLASAVQVYAGASVPHRDAARSSRPHNVLQEGRIVSDTLTNRIPHRISGETMVAQLEICDNLWKKWIGK